MSSAETSLDAEEADALAEAAEAEAALADVEALDALEADSLAADALPDADELAALEEDEPPQAASPKQHAHSSAATNIAKCLFISKSFPSLPPLMAWGVLPSRKYIPATVHRP